MHIVGTALDMHMPVSEFLQRFTSYEIRELIAFAALQERTRLEGSEGKEGIMARAKKINRERASNKDK